MIRIGFILNPYAGLGGPAGFKGSDLPDLQQSAHKGEIKLLAPDRAMTFWSRLVSHQTQFELIAAPGLLGADVLSDLNIAHQVLPAQVSYPTTSDDTIHFAKALLDQGVDLLVFVGGDGTARDVYRAVGPDVKVLGIPAGVKMHSGVYAINPQSAAELVKQLINGQLMASRHQEVRDIDESLFRQGRVQARHYGEMLVPEAAEYVQAVKQGGIENEALVLLAMADDLRERLDDDMLIVWAPGSTTLGVLAEWGHQGTLLGVDALHPQRGLLRDLNADDLTALVADYENKTAIVLTAIGGQGHVIGRGNQQITPHILRKVGLHNLHILASKEKLSTLQGRPLLMDSGDAALDNEWSGWVDVQTGYHETVMYELRGG